MQTPPTSLSQDNLRRFRDALQAGHRVFIEMLSGPLLQSIIEVKEAEFPCYHGTHLTLRLVRVECKNKDPLNLYDIQNELFGWREDATESRWVRPKDRMVPVFMDRLGQVVEAGDLVVASKRDGSLDIGQFTRVTVKGTVFVKQVSSGEEFKLYYPASMGTSNHSILKITRDLRDQIMLLKLAS